MKSLLWLLYGVMFVVLFTPTTHALDDPALVVFLSFTARTDLGQDSSGNGNNAQLVGNPEWGVGKFSGGFLQKGEAYLELPDVMGPEGTIEFWLQPNWDGGDDQTYRLFDATFGDKYWFIGKGAEHNDFPNNEMGFYFEDGADADWQDVDINVDGVIVAGTWYHIAVTWEFNGGAPFFYIDGEEMATSGNALGVPPVFNPAPRIGLTAINYIPAANGSNGTIDEFMLYSRALEPDEIKKDMEATAPVESTGRLTTTWSRLKL